MGLGWFVFRLFSSRDLEPGDLVEINRGFYSHWVVYIGNGEVVHLTADGNSSFSSSPSSSSSRSKECGKAGVRREDFKKVVGNSPWTKRNGWSSPYSQDEIVRRALSKVGYQNYNLLFGNCEHFAKWCRYGIPLSIQVGLPLFG